MEFFTGIWYYVLPFLLVLTVLVFVHELGHYLVARWCRVRVEVFSIGFGPEIYGFTDKQGTRWKFSAIPFGGYVKMFGEHSPDGMADEGDEQPNAADEAVSFYKKTVSQRAAIVFAGPFANFLFAVIALAGLFSLVGQPYTPPDVGEVMTGSAAERAGLKAGDVVVRIDGTEIERFEQIRQLEQLAAGRPLEIVVRRNGRNIELTAVPDTVEVERFGNLQKVGRLGVRPYIPPVIGSVMKGSAAERAGLEAGDVVVRIDSTDIQRFEQIRQIVLLAAGRPLKIVVRRNGRDLVLTAVPDAIEVKQSGGARKVGQLGVRSAKRDMVFVRHDPLTAVWRAVIRTSVLTGNILEALGEIISGARTSDELGGPLRIAQLSGEMAQAGLVVLIQFTVILSINLGLINLFPIPMLDGGHLMFYAIEAIRGRPVSERAMGFSLNIGLALILGLTVFVTWNDLVQLKVVEYFIELVT